MIVMRREGDIVLIYYQDQPGMFARIESIEPDFKKSWYQVTLLLLTIPTQAVTWILRESYIDGAPFTMSGMAIRLEEVKRVEGKKAEPEEDGKANLHKGLESTGKVIPFKKG